MASAEDRPVVVVGLWEPHDRRRDQSGGEFERPWYDESWVEKLYRGVKKHTTHDFIFSVCVDYEREFSEPVLQHVMTPREGGHIPPDLMWCFNWDGPLIFMGLDTVIVGDMDWAFDYVLNGEDRLMPVDPYKGDVACNGVVLCPEGTALPLHERWWIEERGLQNDMEACQALPYKSLDEMFPGKVLSYKKHCQHCAEPPVKASIVYFHGNMKPNQRCMSRVRWVKRAWT